MSKKSEMCIEVEELQQQAAPMMRTHYYSKHGIQINSQWWFQLHHDRTYCSIAFANVTRTKEDFKCEESSDGKIKIPKDKLEVLSIHTTWQGVDDREVKQGPPLIFETRIESDDCFWVWPSSDLALAEVIHAIVLSQLHNGVPPEKVVVDNPFN